MREHLNKTMIPCSGRVACTRRGVQASSISLFLSNISYKCQYTINQRPQLLVQKKMGTGLITADESATSAIQGTQIHAIPTITLYVPPDDWSRLVSRFLLSAAVVVFAAGVTYFLIRRSQRSQPTKDPLLSHVSSCALSSLTDCH